MRNIVPNIVAIGRLAVDELVVVVVAGMFCSNGNPGVISLVDVLELSKLFQTFANAPLIVLNPFPEVPGVDGVGVIGVGVTGTT